MIRFLLAFSLAAVLGAQTPVEDRDSDGDGLTDFQETHKYLTDPAKKDSDGDGVPDGDWSERREFAYTVRTVIAVMRPAEIAAMNDDWQDAKLVRDHGSWIEAEVIHYPFGTAGEDIAANPRWREETAGMRPWLDAGATANWDATMREKLVAEIGDVKALDDKALVEKASQHCLDRTTCEDGFTTFFTAFEGRKPVVPPELKARVEQECKTAGRSLEDEWNHELFAKGMFEYKTRGSCTSSAIYLTGCLRALGIPTRIVLCIPAVDSSDPTELEMVRKNVKLERVRNTMLAALERAPKSWTSHTFNEVWVGGRWRRLNYSRLGQPVLDENYLGLMTHVATLKDWADAKAASTIGKRQAKDSPKDEFGGSNPYSASAIADQVGVHCKADLNAASRPVQSVTLDKLVWSDDEQLPKDVREGLKDGLSLLGRVKNYKDWDPFKAFTEAADRRFFLESDGRPTLGTEAHVGGLTVGGAVCWVIIPLGPADREALVKGAAYTLKPRNDRPGLRWVVAEGLKVTRNS